MNKIRRLIYRLRNSLRGRLLVAASLVLVCFLSLTGFVLDKAYEESAEVSQYARLEADIHDLLRIADPGSSSSLVIPGDATDHRLMQLNSGLYAQVSSQDGHLVWQSPSMVGEEIAFHQGYSPAQQEFYQVQNSTSQALFAMSLGVTWVDNTGLERIYTFSVAESQHFYHAQVNTFRQALWFWLSGLVCILLLVQWGILNWGLTPIRRLAKDVREVESGHRDYLQDNYIEELRRLTNNLNGLIRHERKRQERYRNATSDLAHSLKTPLAVLRGMVDGLEDKHQPWVATFDDQVQRLSQITSYQLQRAVTSGKSTFAKPIAIEPYIEKIINALHKVYRDKNVHCRIDLAAGCVFFGQEGDLYEVAGNLLENAFKYGENSVHIKARMQKGQENEKGIGLLLTITNDGPGIAEDAIRQVLERGVRADSKNENEGQGIGLAIINDIVDAYDGEIEIASPQKGGAEVEVFFPR